MRSNEALVPGVGQPDEEKTSPTVSVVIPVYNSSAYLQRCLDSLFAQTFEDFEIICVDDGSTDGSLELLEENRERDGRLVGILQQEHGGPGVARNAGIAEARGEFLFFLDSDDFVDKTLFEKAVARAEDTSSDIVVWDIWFYNHKFDRIQHPYHDMLCFRYFDTGEGVFSWKDNPGRIFNCFQNWPWNKLFRTSLIRDNGLEFSTLRRTEDLPFTCMALVCAERIACLYDRLTYYRMSRHDSAMATKDRWPFDFLKAFVELRGLLEARGIYEEVKQSYVNWALSGTMYNLMTLNAYESYATVYAKLLEFGFEEMDLEDYGREYFYDGGLYDEFLFINSHAPEEFMFRKAKEYDSYHVDCLAAYDFLEGELATAKAQADEAEQSAESLRSELTALQGATEQRVGEIMCKIPRAIQRRVLDAKRKEDEEQSVAG